MAESPESKITSRKFWLGVSFIVAVLYLSTRLVHRLAELLEQGHLNEAVFERLVSVLISTDAMLLGFVVGLYWGINVWQKGLYLKEGGDK